MAKRSKEMSLIEDKTKREECFKKTTKSLVKKLEELCTLCGVEACCIAYGPGNTSAKPDVVWPPSAKDVVTKFQNLSHEAKSRKMFDQETYAKEKIEKLQEQLGRLKNSNRQKVAEFTVARLMVSGKTTMDDLNLDDLNVDDLKQTMRISSIMVNKISDQIKKLSERSEDPSTSVGPEKTLVSGSQNGFKFDLNEPPAEV